MFAIVRHLVLLYWEGLGVLLSVLWVSSLYVCAFAYAVVKTRLNKRFAIYGCLLYGYNSTRAQIGC